MTQKCQTEAYRIKAYIEQQIITLQNNGFVQYVAVP